MCEGFYATTDFSNIIRCADGTHVPIIAPHSLPILYHHSYYSLNVRLPAMCKASSLLLFPSSQAVSMKPGFPGLQAAIAAGVMTRREGLAPL